MDRSGEEVTINFDLQIENTLEDIEAIESKILDIKKLEIRKRQLGRKLNDFRRLKNEEQKNKRAVHFERIFIENARKILDEETFEKIMDVTHEEIRNNPELRRLFPDRENSAKVDAK